MSSKNELWEIALCIFIAQCYTVVHREVSSWVIKQNETKEITNHNRGTPNRTLKQINKVRENAYKQVIFTSLWLSKRQEFFFKTISGKFNDSISFFMSSICSLHHSRYIGCHTALPPGDQRCVTTHITETQRITPFLGHITRVIYSALFQNHLLELTIYKDGHNKQFLFCRLFPSHPAFLTWHKYTWLQELQADSQTSGLPRIVWKSGK